MSVHPDRLFSKEFFRKMVWKYNFSHLIDIDAYHQIFDKAKLKKMYKEPEKLNVLHLYSPQGALPSALQSYLHPRNQIVMDPFPKCRAFYQKHLFPLVKKYNEKVDDAHRYNLKICVENPYKWESYHNFFNKESFIPEEQSDDHIHTNFLVTCNYTNSFGEQLAVQHLNTFGNRNWIQKYGRVRMLSLLDPASAGKFFGYQRGKILRNRMTVQAQAYADAKLLAVSRNGLSHFPEEFIEKSNPVILEKDQFLSASDSMAVVDFQPKKVPTDVNLDEFDYITKTLLVTKIPLKESIDLLGFGASEFFLNEPDFKPFMDKSARDLSAEEFFKLTKLFGYWPFRPDVMLTFEDIGGRIEDTHNRR
ncbi:RNA polymerase specificity factor [Saccharomycopsis crataegensis]|uniref:rRNA adenine N(6)-methyltransferase n=1 Tax=Saccharomycopsis crataegensis TaxID=43959 RepID=A0AAV5QMY4_9ASCO|nr:RNA polymerase specificity factor [Saccharomycopsis crataegensis]